MTRWSKVDLYFFDFDKTLYAFDFRARLPALSLLSGVSRYRIAKNWREARALASTAIPASVSALRRASTLGTVSMLSNNPSPFAEAFPLLAPDVSAIVGENRLVSCQLGVRKPAPRLFELALEHYGARAADTFFVDDSADNVAGARFVGIHAHQLVYVDGVPQTGALDAAITRFANRNA